MDERVKVLSIFLFIFTLVGLNKLAFLGVIAVISLSLALHTKVRLRTLLYPIYVASVVFLVLAFSGYPVKAFKVFLKVVSATSLLLYASRDMISVVSALSLFLPKDVAEIAMLMFRYMETMMRTGSTLLASVRTRGGFLGRTNAIRNLGMVGGVLIVNAFDKAERVYMSMLARGYDGGIFERRGLDSCSILTLFAFLCLCLVIWWVGR